MKRLKKLQVGCMCSTHSLTSVISHYHCTVQDNIAELKAKMSSNAKESEAQKATIREVCVYMCVCVRACDWKKPSVSPGALH